MIESLKFIRLKRLFLQILRGMKSIIKNYFKVYEGLSRAAWMLALVMLVNRSGAMVVPFLGVYMVNKLGFSLEVASVLVLLAGLHWAAG